MGRTSAGKIKLKFKVRNFDIRKTATEFGRCFCSGSITCGSMRINQVQIMSWIFKMQWEVSQHVIMLQVMEAFAKNILHIWAWLVLNARSKFICFEVGTLHCWLCNVRWWMNLQQIATNAADAIRDESQERHHFFDAFTSNQGNLITTYNENHKNRTGLG